VAREPDNQVTQRVTGKRDVTAAGRDQNVVPPVTARSEFRLAYQAASLVAPWAGEMSGAHGMGWA
jgi:hypothetical protein